MNYNKKRMATAVLLFFFGLSAVGCTQTPSPNESSSADSATTESALIPSTALASEDMFTDSDKEIGYDESTAIAIGLRDDHIQCDSLAVTLTGNTVTITDEGTYFISGSLSNGQLVVDAKKTDKIHLVLNGVNLNCDTSAAIYVKQADKVFITLAEDTRNTLSNKDEFVAIDENSIDGVIFSKDDLTLNGSGTLTVDAAFGHGIVSKDDLVITSGTYDISAADHALFGKDSVRIAQGSFLLTSGKDGIQAENAEDTTLGFLYIAGGNFEITSAGDGLSASSTLQIESGIVRIEAGGGSQNGAVQGAKTVGLDPWHQQDSATVTETVAVSVSTKGMKAAGNLILNGGEITIDSPDDGLHAKVNVVIKDGKVVISTGDDGVHADGNVTISSGTLTIAKSYEGIEGQSIDITGGVISIVASDDGLNAASATAQSGPAGQGDSACRINISGGVTYINAASDGIDSNGNFTVSGGETRVSGPTNGGNSALDYDGKAQITGGIFVAVGPSAMAQNFGSDSTQGTIMVDLATNQGGGEVVLKDSAGQTLLSYTPEKVYNCVLVSCPEINQGESYTLEAGSETATVEMTSLVYGSGGEMGGHGGGRGGGSMG